MIGNLREVDPVVFVGSYSFTRGLCVLLQAAFGTSGHTNIGLCVPRVTLEIRKIEEQRDTCVLWAGELDTTASNCVNLLTIDS